SGGSGTGTSGGSATGSSGGSGIANCVVVNIEKKVTGKDHAQIRKSEKNICVDNKGNSKLVSGDEQERNKGNDDNFGENQNAD
ncbi:hypothetical protein M3I54_40665, partial [Paraburkholderia sp. CNPSo 3274]|uniref:hypothetical protein n=1 Tax=Paraburkholderia sp. CNPSo 3274 TaxID=2940932 RepID=UPI0020B6A16C